MVGFYRGNFHRVPGAPRQWLLPRHRLTVSQFRSLTLRRNRALHKANDSPGSSFSLSPSSSLAPCSAGEDIVDAGRDSSKQKEEEESDKVLVLASNANTVQTDPGGTEEVALIPEQQVLQEKTVSDVYLDKEIKKIKLERKLQLLNDRKHHLVQTLKQILNAEEEIKKRNTPQVPMLRVVIPTQSDGAVDMGPVSTSPSASSLRPPHNPLQNNAVTPSSRVLSPGTGNQSSWHQGVAASPSLFSPGGVGHTSSHSLLTAPASHPAASPSPTASSGAPTFKDNCGSSLRDQQ